MSGVQEECNAWRFKVYEEVRTENLDMKDRKNVNVL